MGTVSTGWVAGNKGVHLKHTDVSPSGLHVVFAGFEMSPSVGPCDTIRFLQLSVRELPESYQRVAGQVSRYFLKSGVCAIKCPRFAKV